MVRSLRNALIGLLSLSMVGCANMSTEDVVGIVIGVGALTALALMNNSNDDEQGAEDCKKRHKHCDNHEHRHNHAKCN